MTPDLLRKLQPELQAVQLDALQFLKSPDVSVLQQFPGSARQFLAINDGLVMVATARDPCIYQYAGMRAQATDTVASVTTHTGGHTVTPAQYMEIMTALAPDILVALSDEVPADAKRERAVASVDRSLAWLRDCLAARAQSPALGRSVLFAPVQGAGDLAERQRAAHAVAEMPGPAGYAICGLGTGESPEQRRQILATVIAALPANRPRLASGVGTPEEVLAAVAQGVDLFDMGYPTEVTAGGYALCFPLSVEAAAGSDGQQPSCSSHAAASVGDGQQQEQELQPCTSASVEGRDPSKINLWALAYREDKRPLLPGCACFTCTSHPRAYLHHLLHTHEMTAQVLLDVHNSHHYLAFFATIRRAIAAGSFAQYHAAFLERRQRLLLQDV